MTPFTKSKGRGILLASFLLAGAPLLPAQAPTPPTIGKVQTYSFATKALANDQKVPVLVAEKLVRFPGASFLQIGFKEIRLGEGSTLEVQSLVDDETQVWTSTILAEQGAQALESYYFNGDAVLIRLWAGPGSKDNSFAIKNVGVGNPAQASNPMTICGTDNRVKSNDPRVARIILKRGTSISWCTAWLISPVNCFATAGHCLASSTLTNVTAQFNVPMSTSSGNLVSPSISNQYNWEGTAKRLYESGGVGKDWGVFTTQKNSSTQRYAGSVQKTYFQFQSVPSLNTSLTIRGHGTDKTPNLTYNGVQQTASGPLVQIGGTFLRYRVDTMGGNSGSPVYVASTGRAIGVHTHGGCTSTGGSNAGTRADYSSFVSARARLCTRKPQPDFRATYISTTSSFLRGRVPATFISRISNVGTATAPIATHGVYISTNSIISTADLLVQSFNTPALSIGGTYTRTASSTVPANVPNGICYLGLLADRLFKVAEESEANNTIARTIRCIGLPDLDVTYMLPSTTLLTPNKVFTIRSTIKNIGKTTSASCVSGYYLSTNSLITTGDTLLLSFTTAALAVNGSQTLTHTVRAPSKLTTGTCYLGTYADRLFRVPEINEGNNTYAYRVTCSQPTPRPDLVVTAFRASTTIWYPGQAVTGSTTVKNIGNATAGTSLTGIYLSPNSTISTIDTLLGSYTTGILVANASRTLNYSVRIPITARPGICYLGALADRTRVVTESNELNNYRSVLGRCLGKADLTITAVTPPTSGRAGGLISVTTTTKNIGTASAASSFTGIYLSTNNVITTFDRFLGNYSTGVLIPGGSKTLTTRHQIPYCTRSGRYYLGAIADNGGTVSEISEGNNSRSASSTTSIAGYTGSARMVEFIPIWGSPALSTTYASFSARRGGRASMCVTAPRYRGYWYLLLWSGGATRFSLDALTNFQLSLLNSPIFFRWFGKTSSITGTAYPSFFLPRTVLRTGFDAYTYSFWFNPTLTRIAGFGTNHIRTRINP